MPTPPGLQRIVDLFAEAPRDLRLEALLEYSRGLPPLPPRLQGHREAMEQVVECQTPFFLASEVGDDHRVQIWFDAPPEAPTTRGFAGILHEGLNGLTAGEVLGVPDDAPYRFGLSEAVSPLRLRGMVAMLSRIKRQVRLKAAA